MNRLANSLLALALLSSSLLAAGPAAADVVGTVCRVGARSHVEVLVSTERSLCFGFLPRSRGGAPQSAVLLEHPVSGDVLASADGRTVLFLSTYLDVGPTREQLASWRKSPRVAGPLATAALQQNPVVVQLFHDGQLVKTHHLRDIARLQDLQESISHVRWAGELPAALAGDVLRIPMGSGGTVALSLRTGEILSRP